MIPFFNHRCHAYGTATMPQVVGSQILLEDTFTDADNTPLANHKPDLNTTGDVWHDPNNVWKIVGNTVVRVGGDVYTNFIVLGKMAWQWSGQIVIPAGDFDVSLLFRSNGAQGLRYQMHSNGNIWVRDFGTTTYATFAKLLLPGTYNFMLTHTDAGVVLNIDMIDLAHTSTLFNWQTGIGMSCWSGCNPKFDNFYVTPQ